MTPPPDLSTTEIERRVHDLGEWFHNIDLGGVATAPAHPLGDYPGVKWPKLGAALPADLSGARVLDIGCNAGFFSIQLKRRGAERVVGIDTDERYLAQARFAAEVCGVAIELRRMSVYDVADLGARFDIVLFMGVAYHLRHPLLALDLIWEHAALDVLVFQSMLRGCDSVEPLPEDHPYECAAVFDAPSYPKLHFVEHRYCGDDTNWWVPNRACAEAMLRSAGFTILGRPENDAYLCRRVARGGHSGAVHPSPGPRRRA